MTDHSPAVSVVLPVRNAAATVRQALDSVLSQTFTDFELIAVDDASTDDSRNILERTAERDSRVRVVSNEGRGLTVALSRGLALAKGRFVARQDADDVSMPERFARQVQWLEEHPRLCAIGTGTLAIDTGGRPLAPLRIKRGTAAVRRGIRSARVVPVHGSMMIRRDCLTAVGGYRDAFINCQDFDLWLRLVERYEIDNLEDRLYHWRLTSDSVYGSSRRMTQLLYGGVALAFASERARFGADSYGLLQAAGGDFEAFANDYRFGGLLHSIWGDLFLRGLSDSRLAHRHLTAALRGGHVTLFTALLWAWTSIGIPWIGSKPLRAPEDATLGGRVP